MNRITPEMVKEAFVSRGIRPTNFSFYDIDNKGNECGCLFTALAASKYPEKGVAQVVDEIVYSKGDADGWSTRIADEFGFPKNYVIGCVRGFDWGRADEWRSRDDTELLRGIKDGIAIREYLIQEGMLEVDDD